MKPRLLTILILLILPMLLMGAIHVQTTAMTPTEMTTGTTIRVSVASDGTQGNNSSTSPSISADGRYVAFASDASNLVPGDTNDAHDVFVHDRQTGQIARVSIASDGTQGDGASHSPSISANGRYVAFASDASNLVPGDTNYNIDVFVHDQQTGQSSRISVASDGTQGNRQSAYPSISADGRYVAFRSYVSNLVSGDTNNSADIFVHDRQTGQTSRVSVASDGTQGNSQSGKYISISADGHYVAFNSDASNLIPGDTNNNADIFVHDRQTGQTSRVSVASDGTQGNSQSGGYISISADGHYVAFNSDTSNLVPGDTNDARDVFVHDRQTGQTTRVSIASDGTQGNSGPLSFGGLSISADGRYVAFNSRASNLVPGDTNGWDDVFVHDRQTEQMTRVSVTSDGTQGNFVSWIPSISADGRYVAFHSQASNLVPSDTNNVADIFVHDRSGSAFSVSGSIVDSTNNPISGVTVSTNTGHSAIGNINGNYTITGLITGTYTITPNKIGYTFSPPSRTVSVPPNATGQDFTATATSIGCGNADMNRQPVLLVHGWGGPDVLAADEPGFAQLYQWMAADGYVEGCNLFYATGVTSTKTREQNRGAIQRNLRDVYAQLVLSNPQWRGHFDIIGHSYGGLNARFYLESDYYQEDRSYGQYGIHVDNLFTLGSPHGGSRIPQEAYPGAGAIAGVHILAPFNLADFLSAAQLHRSAMDLYNFSHIQPSDVRYHLIGGDFLEQGNVPFAWRVLYSPWFGHPGDIGVSLRSSRQLGVNPLLQFRYPSVCVVTNEDMHGYIEEFGLGNLNSYVYPAVTYSTYIRDTLGTWSSSCPASALTYADYASVMVEDELPFVSPILLGSSVLAGGQTAAADFPVDWSGQSVFYVSWSGGDMDFTLVDGLGQAITPAVAQTDPNIDYEKLADAVGGLATYNLTNTAIGLWSYTVSAVSGPYPITYTVYANADTALTVEAFAPEWQPFGTPVVLTATMMAAGTPVTGAAITTTVTLPDGSRGMLLLHDDGIDADTVADDGIYTGQFQETNQGGFYWVSVIATGSYEGHDYRRTTNTVFSVASTGAALSGAYSDRGIDNTGDGIYEWLEFEAQIGVTKAAPYTLSADLYAGEMFITHAWQQAYLAVGQPSIAVRFAGSAIFEHGLDGPYTIRNVLLLEEAPLTLLIEAADNVHTTQAYRYTDFGQHKLYLPAVLHQ